MIGTKGFQFDQIFTKSQTLCACYQQMILIQANIIKQFSYNPVARINMVQSFKGSVSQILRWVLLYINRKLSLRPIIALLKILSLLKGQFPNYKKQSGEPLYCDMVSSRQC